MTKRLLSRLKNAFLPAGKRPHRALFGLYSGLLLDVDLRHNTQLLLGLLERETYGCITEAAGRCHWAIDVGAGTGELVLRLLKGSPAEVVIAVEPKAEAREAILQNLRLNGLDAGRLEIKDCCLGQTQGSHFSTLDALAMPLSGRGFIKIDVDGAEVDVLQSGNHSLARGNLDLLVETHSAALERGCLELLEQNGFSCHVIKNAWWRTLLPELRPIAHNRWLWGTRGVSAS